MEDRLKCFNAAIVDVMTRFRDFFTEHINQDHVPFRNRDDFETPLVTVMGYTFGVRLHVDSRKSKKDAAKLAVEVSTNVYDDEFDLDRFKSTMEETLQPPVIDRTIENFRSPEEEKYLRKGGSSTFVTLFSYELDRDIELLEKEKQTASQVTGRFVDTILTMKYWIKPKTVERLLKDLPLFKSAVYLFCLRTFVLAYHKSLST
jgi:hypothetical protein